MNQRIKHTIGLLLHMGGTDRGKYIKEHHVFRHMGDNVCFMPRKVPLYPNLISIGNNVMIASGTQFLTHDSINRICNRYSEQMLSEQQHDFQENVGCIEIGDNVFIGSGSMICSNVRIGKNSIVTANSVVIKDVPEGMVVRGNPAKVICKFEDYYRMKMTKDNFPREFSLVMGTTVSSELADWLWNKFEEERK